jgi:hypothetical protein
MFDSIDNDDRADFADDGLQALAAVLGQLTLPLSENLPYGEFARATLKAYAAATRHYPVTCFDTPTPPADDRDEAEEIMSDFLGDLRHLLDHHGLTLAAIHAGPPADSATDTGQVHVLAMAARLSLWQYAGAADMRFGELDARGAWHYSEEVAEAAAETAEVPAVPALPPKPGATVAVRVLSRTPHGRPDLLTRYILLMIRLARWLRHLTTPRK